MLPEAVVLIDHSKMAKRGSNASTEPKVKVKQASTSNVKTRAAAKRPAQDNTEETRPAKEAKKKPAEKTAKKTKSVGKGEV